MPLSELARQYLADMELRARPASVRDARKALERIQRDLGARVVRDVTSPLVITWRTRRVHAGASNKTANTEVGYLKAALAHAVNLGQISGHPLQGLRGLPVTARHPRRRPRALSD